MAEKDTVDYKNNLLLRTLSRETYYASEGHKMICGHEKNLKTLDEIDSGKYEVEQDTFKRDVLLTFQACIEGKHDRSMSCKLFIWRDGEEQDIETEKVGDFS